MGSTIVVAIANGVMKTKAPQRLSEFGGPVTFSVEWAKKLINKMGCVRRKQTTGKRQLPANFLVLKLEFLNRLGKVIEQFSIPPQFVINLDQTGLPIRPTTEWTMAPSGSQSVAVDGAEDKRMITMQVSRCRLWCFFVSTAHLWRKDRTLRTF